MPLVKALRNAPAVEDEARPGMSCALQVTSYCKAACDQQIHLRADCVSSTQYAAVLVRCSYVYESSTGAPGAAPRAAAAAPQLAAAAAAAAVALGLVAAAAAAAGAVAAAVAQDRALFAIAARGAISCACLKEFASRKHPLHLVQPAVFAIFARSPSRSMTSGSSWEDKVSPRDI